MTLVLRDEISNKWTHSAASVELDVTQTDFPNVGKDCNGAPVGFAVGQCSLGAILVAATDNGICAILLGDDPETLRRDLQGRFVSTQEIRGDKDFDHLLAQVIEFIEAPVAGLDLPLDLGGTERVDFVIDLRRLAEERGRARARPTSHSPQ